jgi:hypothetical protein
LFEANKENIDKRLKEFDKLKQDNYQENIEDLKNDIMSSIDSDLKGYEKKNDVV